VIGLLGVACLVGATACSSAHHKAARSSKPRGWTAVVRHADGLTYLDLRRAGRRTRTFVVAENNCCGGDVIRTSNHVVVFGSDDFLIKTIDLRSGLVRNVAEANQFNVSDNGRWIAWTRFGAESTPDRVGVVSVTGMPCLPVVSRSDESDSLAYFHPDAKRVYFLREQLPGRDSGRTVSLALASLKRGPGCS
jgi:tricorn protease-like protein